MEIEKENKWNTETNMVNTEIVPGYSNVSKRCLLCLQEKMYIATYRYQEVLLNKWPESILKCRHENKFLLANYKAND